MPDRWDWTAATTYEFRTRRIRARFRYRFVRELFDVTMGQGIDFLEKRGGEIDQVFGSDPRRTQNLTTITGVFQKAAAADVRCLSELMDQVRTRESAAAFIERVGLAIDDLKATLVEIDYYMLPTQKTMRLLIPKSDMARNAFINKLVEQGAGNNLALLEAARTAADRAELARKTGIPDGGLLDLVHRADMGRQHCMARMVADHYDAGYDTMATYRAVTPEQARAAGIDLGRVLYARTRPAVLQDVPELPMPELTQREAKPRRAGCGNGCMPCTGPWGCALEKCVRRNRVPNCAHCSAFPCGAYGGDRETARLEDVRAGLAPEQIVAMKPLRPIRPAFVPFPVDIELPPADEHALRHVHSLLVAARQMVAGNSYAHRLRMDFTRRHVFDVLWCLAHHGEFVAEPTPHLYLRKGNCRRDGQRMPDPHAQVFEQLSLPGVTVEEKQPPGKARRRVDDDECRLFLSATAGGGDALRMLRRFGDALCQRHGEPEWKGQCRWKGDAFQRFVAADVSCVTGAKAKPGGTT
ncbi:MAG: DUF3795 domain-containing protein [Lentisphaerae bacterium]|jgi:hypothetical protein|nr:DUF3795 domain-containing protein [Lentisphaerota bacterium]MBT4822359.1 DUF3795 domain-containing protein [Lentisphaerota bacterium]MBT5609888.1 DUF3795 domain-containing protein [Lentisphaerota bacterium]MBT7055088.1 DUF3795 domain-containing protein [Lentisphaerota bacterium]MBT7842508.1 DUF3795 domain-containing protein [Lentisphaerota bacterium]